MKPMLFRLSAAVARTALVAWMAHDAVASPAAVEPVIETESTQEILGAIPGAGPAAPVGPSKTGAAGPGPSQKKSIRPTPLPGMPSGLGFEAGPTAGPTDNEDAERVVFQRAPIRVALSVNQERLVTFPGPIAFRAPEGFEGLVQTQIIDRTAYLKAIAPFGSIRVVAEDLGTGRQIPIDLVSDSTTTVVKRPVEVMVPAQMSSDTAVAGNETKTLDMVGLTRYAAQSLYAPRRLVPAVPGVKQLPIASVPVEGLYRGWRVQTTPIGAWRSGQLYVTAVRFTNQGQQPLDIDLQEMRGRWLAATAQHTRLLAAGSDWSTTTVYLVCDRPFDACR